MTNSAYAKNNGDGLLYSILCPGYEKAGVQYDHKPSFHFPNPMSYALAVFYLSKNAGFGE